ncbi:MAG TPA: acetyl-CoA carboxylase biotin carboxyl carrier protein [Amoebophilaceae bacterium]|jgi:acetyl-CoA carboxylase biotin carboxyl carrier protein|nr:acetyl-CoA carboxylase biotin carboxyl carrier protein [Amoebophilaceae bacterium]
MTTVTEIQDLIDFITKSGLQEVKLETEALKLHIKRNIAVAQQVPLPTEPLLPEVVAQQVPLPTASTLPDAAPVAPAPPKNCITIVSPMVGTFYRASHPDAPPFVQVGDKITKGSKLCIIEAMKLYNEIEAEVSGKIVEILVDNVSPVEYDQPLFRIDPT